MGSFEDVVEEGASRARDIQKLAEGAWKKGCRTGTEAALERLGEIFALAGPISLELIDARQLHRHYAETWPWPLDSDISLLYLSKAAEKLLRRNGYSTIEDVADAGQAALNEVEGLGGKSITIIRIHLACAEHLLLA